MVRITSAAASIPKDAPPRPLTAAIEIAAPPDSVWRVVSDVRRTGEWSTECRRVLARRGVGVGSLIVGINRRKAVVWATVSRISDLTAERSISWVVLTNRSVWTYSMAPVDGVTHLTQTRATPRGESRFALWFTRAFLGGQAVHDDELERAMGRGLEVIKTIAERAG
jgi:hypothetical protein